MSVQLLIEIAKGLTGPRFGISAPLVRLCIWVALGFGLAVIPVMVGGVEFVVPPGVDVAKEEEELKARVLELVMDLVGEDLIDVQVTVGYLQSKNLVSDSEKVKLPGFDRYVRPKKKKKAKLVTGYSRVRQILVLIKDSFPVEESAIAEELRATGEFDPEKGDRVRVVKTTWQAARGAPDADGQERTLAEDANRLSNRLRRVQARQAEERGGQAIGRIMAQGTMSEAKSTSYLLKARSRYFNGDYRKALDQILRSINENPNNPQAYAMLGSLYYAVDWKYMAIKYWGKSLELDPENRELENLMDKVRLKQGR